MIIDAIGDLHGHLPELEGGDLLLLIGDYTAMDTVSEWHEFYSWLERQRYRKKIMIAGNHDNHFQVSAPIGQGEWNSLKEVQDALDIVTEFEYLCDSGIEFEGYKIWGSPWTSQFPGINPKCCAFTFPFSTSLEEKWSLIPDDVDILLTHIPPFGIFDRVGDEYGACVGDVALLEVLEKRIKPKIHVFGHVHEQGGRRAIYKRDCRRRGFNTLLMNCSYVDEHYRPVHKPMRVIL